MAKLWLKDGKIVAEGGVNPILCDTCPCGGIPNGIFFGGEFDNGSGAFVAYYDFSSFGAVPGDFHDDGTSARAKDIRALIFWNGLLYAGGSFGDVDSISGTRLIAAWDGSTWADVGGGNLETGNNSVNRMIIWNDLLVVAGNLDQFGSTSSTSHIVAWNGSAWSQFASGPLIGEITALRDIGGTLYVGGNNEYDYWDGASWVPTNLSTFSTLIINGTTYDGTIQGTVYDLLTFGGNLWIAGQFQYVVTVMGVPTYGGDAFAFRVISSSTVEFWIFPTISAPAGSAFGDKCTRLIDLGGTLQGVGRVSNADNAGWADLSIPGSNSPMSTIFHFTGSGWVGDLYTQVVGGVDNQQPFRMNDGMIASDTNPYYIGVDYAVNLGVFGLGVFTELNVGAYNHQILSITEINV